MLTIQSKKYIPMDTSDGRELRYVMRGEEWQKNDPFVILADDRFGHNTFMDHPHKGIETVSYIVEGSLTHYDSKTGGGGLLSDGDFQLMTAGRGVIHNENPAPGEKVRVLQLWNNLSAAHKKHDAGYQDVPADNAPEVNLDGASIKVFSGEGFGVKGPLTNLTKFTHMIVTLEQGATLSMPIITGDNYFLYMLDGAIEVLDQKATANEFIRFGIAPNAEELVVTATEKTQFLFLGGTPIREPFAARGPFVMNTEEELMEAFRDYRNGTFLD
jgi:quercetin 2,3-dioxygenase